MSEPDPSLPAEAWLTPERYRRIHDLVEEAERLPRDARTAFVIAAADDPRLRAEVFALLESSEVLHGPRAFDAGDRIGPYRIERSLGGGGMGAVYLARRADASYDRLVAIKVIRPDLAGPQVAARFALETRILASLNHPNIATLVDAGTLDDGRPYIVMEFVDGMPLTDYADRGRLTIAERLRLIRAVCDAVAHAHERLVIHRDIKPGNIIVTADGTPKLLDFGIAKLLTPGGLDAAQITAAAVGPGTPLYSSPEQLGGAAIDTSTDVFAIGIVIFELLTGRWPYDPRQPRPAVVPAMSTVAPLADWPGPSGPNRPRTPADIAAARQTTPKTLTRELQGDLDAIVAAALRTSAHQRYRSIADVGADLDRYLASQPVTVRPPSFAYLARKFWGRNRAAATASAVAVLMLIGGIVGTFTQWQRAEALRQRAERRFDGVRSLAGSVLDLTGEIGPAGEQARAALIKTSLQYYDGLEREAGADPALLREAASGFRRVGDAQRQPGQGPADPAVALASYRRAVRASERAAAAEPASPAARKDLAVSLEKVGTVLDEQGDAQGRATLDRSLKLYQDVLDADRSSTEAQRDLLHAYVRYADTIGDSDPDAARQSLAKAQRIADDLAGRDPGSAAAGRDLALVRERQRVLGLGGDDEALRAQEEEYFAAIRESTDPARLEYFLTRYPNGVHAPEVRSRLARLQRGAGPAPAMRASAAAVDAPIAVPTPEPIAPAPVPIDWRTIPAGRFEMGCDMRPDATCKDDERPRHWVTISRPLRMAATETTLAQYRTYSEATGRPLPEQPAWNTDPRAPVVNVTWDQARAFCETVGGRLPTEAEWEWAARGGQANAAYPWGDSYDRRGNAGFPGRDGWDKTAPAGTFSANGYGLVDMSGNVWEWVADWYAANYYQQSPDRDPPGPPSGLSRVLRGGSFASEPSFLRVTQRGVDTMDRRREATGFRCAR